MHLDPVILSRIQFAFVISFHIIFPAFTIGLAAWLATLEGALIVTRDVVYRRVFNFWLKVFSLSFGMGVVSGIVMAFQFGTNWSVLSERTGPIQGPLLGYEGFTAFMLEATFFGVMLLGRGRVPPWFYFFSCCMVSLGTMFSSFWILCNNSWMQVPLGHTVLRDGLALARGHFLAVHDPIHDHCRQRGSPGKIALLSVLGCRRVRIAGDCGLHGSRLLAVPRQAAEMIRISSKPELARVGAWCRYRIE